MAGKRRQGITLAEATRLSGVPASTLKRWASQGLVPVSNGTWTRAAAAQARVIARMRGRGYSMDAVRDAALGGRLAFGYAEDVFEVPEGGYSEEEVAAETGLEPELIDRLMRLLGTPLGIEERLNDEDVRAMRHCAAVLESGFPLVAFLQLVRVYAQSIRKVADAEVRLFHLYVHEPLMQNELPPLEIAEGGYTKEEAAAEIGLEPELIDRLMRLLGTPLGIEERLNEEDLKAMRHCAAVLESGFPLVAFLQIVRVYAQSIRKVADAEVRLFHLYVHEPLMQNELPPLEIAEEMGDLAADLLPVTAPLMEYMHNRYLRFYIEQDVVGHMETDVGDGARGLPKVTMAFCFIDLAGFTRYTEEEGDEEALDLIERFVETVEATLPTEATIVKTIGDEVMIVSPDRASLTEWAVGFLRLFQERPQPRVGLHYGAAVFRDGDYFGGEVNLAHRVVTRALAGEVLVTGPMMEAIEGSEYLSCEAIGEVALKGFPRPVHLYTVKPVAEAS